MTVWKELVERLFQGHTADPFLNPEKEWRRDRDGFICNLIRRRKVHDPRLKREDIGDWPMFKCWVAPDVAILEAVDGYRDLHAAGLADAEIWTRLDRHLAVQGQAVPDGASIVGYLHARLPGIDPGLLALGDEFLARHVEICQRWLELQPPIRGGNGWCPPEWLTERVTLEEFAAGAGANLQEADGAPAILFLGGGQARRDLAALALRIIDGDEIWTYSSPRESWAKLMGRAGYALVRDGRIVANAVTAMN